MKTDVGLIGKGKWGLKIKNNLIKITNLRFVIGKKHNLFNCCRKNSFLIYLQTVHLMFLQY